MNKSLAFIFTNFNNSRFTVNAVESIHKNIINQEFNIEIIIVDNDSNSSEKNILEGVSKKYENVYVNYLSNNIGYFKGLNEGIKSLKQPPKSYDFVVIGNNDLIFKSDFIKSVYDNYSSFVNYPVISPDIIRLDGFHQNPHVTRPVSKFRSFMYELYFSNFYISKVISFIANLTRKYTQRGDEKGYEKSGEIIGGYGACYILGPLFFENFKYLLAPTFLMGEEFFLTYQLKEKKYKIYYESNIKVLHHDHATVSDLPSRKFWNYSKESYLFIKKFK